MSPDFVRYSAEIETIDPNIDELLAQIIDFWEKKVRESPTTEGTGRAVRGAHAKTLGVVKAEVEILGDVPPALRAGHLRQAGPPRRADPLLQRVQPSRPGRRNSDRFSASRSRSSTSTEPSWSKTSRTRPRSTSCSRTTRPSSPTRRSTTWSSRRSATTAGKYLARGKAGFRELLTDLLTGKGTFEQSDWAWEELFAFVKAAADAGAQSAAEHVLDDGGGASRRLRRQGPRRSGRGQRRARHPPRTRPHAADRTCSVRRWWTNCRHEPSISIFRSSCARTSTRCRSTTRPWNGRRSCRRSSPSDGCISRARTSRARLREGRRARVQPVAGHGRSQAAGRDHGRATHLHRVGQGSPDAEPPAADRAHQRR